MNEVNSSLLLYKQITVKINKRNFNFEVNKETNMNVIDRRLKKMQSKLSYVAEKKPTTKTNKYESIR